MKSEIKGILKIHSQRIVLHCLLLHIGKMTGVVYKSTGSWYVIKDEQGAFRKARTRGRLRIDQDISSTNPIAVGDVVTTTPDEDGSLMVTGILPRRNYIVRVSPHNPNQKHIIASNLDATVLLVTVSSPRTSAGFIDRFLVTAEAYHIPATIVINKTDLLTQKDMDIFEDWQQTYTGAGYQVLTISAIDKRSVTPLLDIIRGRTTLLAAIAVLVRVH